MMQARQKCHLNYENMMFIEVHIPRAICAATVAAKSRQAQVEPQKEIVFKIIDASKQKKRRKLCCQSVFLNCSCIFGLNRLNPRNPTKAMNMLRNVMAVPKGTSGITLKPVMSTESTRSSP